MESSIIKGDWVEKEQANGYSFLPRYQPRYLILTTTHLIYYHKHPDSSGHFRLSTHEKREIPLCEIDEDNLLDSFTTQSNMLHVQIPERSYRFRFAEEQDVSRWQDAIIDAIESLKLKTLIRPPFSGENKMKAKPFCNLHLTIEQQETIIQFERFAFCTIEQAKFSANIFFESLALLPSKERNTRAREVSENYVLFIS